MADLQNEVWIDTQPEIGSSTPPRRKATAPEAYVILTRAMLQARVDLRNDTEEKQQASENYYTDRLDVVWDQLTESEQDALPPTVEEFLVPHEEKDVYRDEHGVKRWKATKELVRCTWNA